MSRLYVGLGSNLGDRARNLRDAVALISRLPGVEVQRSSALYDSAPVGPEQPRFLNAVVEVDTDLPWTELLAALQMIERELGREPSQRWGPRLIDLDLLLGADGEIVADPLLQVPHVELHRRAFALAPLTELCPHCVHPVLKRSVTELLAGLPPQDVEKLELDWAPLS